MTTIKYYDRPLVVLMIMYSIYIQDIGLASYNVCRVVEWHFLKIHRRCAFRAPYSCKFWAYMKLPLEKGN